MASRISIPEGRESHFATLPIWGTWLSAAFLVTFLASGASLAFGQDVQASIALPAEPQLLSEAEVEAGLQIRGQEMRERYEARQDRRLQEAPRNYDTLNPKDAAALFEGDPDWEATLEAAEVVPDMVPEVVP